MAEEDAAPAPGTGPVVIHGPRADVAAIQAAILARVELRATPGRPATRAAIDAEREARLAELDPGWDFPRATFDAMWPPALTAWNLDQDFPIRSHRPGLGPVLVAFKRLVRALLRPLVRPLLTQQATINRALGMAVHKIADDLAAERLARQALQRSVARVAGVVRELRGNAEPLVVFADEMEAGRGEALDGRGKPRP